MDEKTKLIDAFSKAFSNLKLIVEKAQLGFKEHSQLQADLALLANGVQECVHLKYPEEKADGSEKVV